MKINSKVSLLVLLLLASVVTRSAAQSSTFTYQGRLTDGGTPANSPPGPPYQMQFTLFPSAVGGDPLGPPIQIDSVEVANGVFTVQLDFGGAAAFDGHLRWLQIAVKKPTDHLFSLLTPRQPLTSTPYALRTLVANSADTLSSACTLCVTNAHIQAVDGSKVTGTVPNAANAINVTGVVPGAIKWQVVSGQSQQAQANTGYLTTNDGPVTITLPTSPNVGDVVRVSASGTGGWKIVGDATQALVIEHINLITNPWTPHENNRAWSSVASSADGTKLVAVVYGGKIYTSTDSGDTWTEAQEQSRQWFSVASSADGTKLVAAVLSGQIYTSIDSGANWAPHESNRRWQYVASSADGTKLVAVGGDFQTGEKIYISTNSGDTWDPRAFTARWRSVASSADGTKLVAAGSNGTIHTSTDSGGSWFQRTTDNLYWTSVASSADGTRLVAVAQAFGSAAGGIYTSSDSGGNWQLREGTRNWTSVASSADGTKLVAADGGGQIYTSTDSGFSWTPKQAGNWVSVASSADGAKLVAVENVGRIFTANLRAANSMVGGQFSSVELVYIGGGQFLPISHEGTIVTSH